MGSVITDLIIQALTALIAFVASLLPPWHLEMPGISPLVSTLSRWDNFVPLTEITQQVTIVVALFAVLVGFKLVIKFMDWLTNIIP